MKESLAHNPPNQRSPESALRRVPSHENDLLESSPAKRIQCGAGLRTVTRCLDGKLGTVDAGSMSRHRERKRLLETGFLIAFIDGRYRLFCILKLSTSEQVVIKWVLQPIWMPLISASDSEDSTDHVLVQLLSSVSTLSEPVLGEESVTAVIIKRWLSLARLSTQATTSLSGRLS